MNAVVLKLLLGVIGWMDLHADSVSVSATFMISTFL